MIVIDFGTATTFDAINNNTFKGRLIFSGIKISYNSLAEHSSKLKKFNMVKTKNIIDNNTKESLQTGLYLGYLYLVNGIIRRFVKTFKNKPKTVLSGGLAKLYKDSIYINSIYDPDLTLEGLYFIGKKKYD